MKKLLIVVLFGLLCMEVAADPITLSQARRLAAAYMPSVAHSPALVRRASAPAADGAQQNLYVFSRGENQGYVIVSGNDALPAVIGYTESGDFDEDKLPPALKHMLDFYAASADSLNALPQARAPRRAPSRAAGTKNIPPLMTTHWHQDGPYNDQAPFIKGTQNRAVTGCVATAASQVLYYWRRDLGDRTKYNTPTYDYGSAPVTESIPSGTPLKWDLMRDSYNGTEPAEMHEAVATLMAVVGRSGYLSYNSAAEGGTAGQIDDQRKHVFGGQFGLNAGTTVWHHSYDEPTWEKMIVDELEAGNPLLYAGYAEALGGHAVVLDGYQKSSNLFHFNFGWGGQGDGYFTVDTTNGMAGFYDWQGMVMDVRPKKANITGKLYLESDTVYTRVGNRIQARITNNGTLPQQGFYVYLLYGPTQPSNATSQPAKEEETVIAVGESTMLEFEYTPTTARNYTVYLTDKNKNVLDKITAVPAVASVATLTLHSLGADGLPTETLTTADGEVQVHHVYASATADITARFTNASVATRCAPSVHGTLYAWQDGEFVKKITKTKKDVTFRPGETTDMVFDLTKLEQDIVYKFELDSTASTNRKYDIVFEASSAVYFKLKGENLTAVPSADGLTLTLAGNYNAQAFLAMAQTDSVACYDLRQVKGVDGTLKAANPNALFYVSSESMAAGTNVIADDVCQQLFLIPGHNFQPQGDFHAMQATYRATQAVGRFATAVLPFDAATPRGMMARRVAHVRSTGISQADSCNLQMYAGTPYIILSGMPVDINAQNVAVSITRPSLASDTLAGTYINLTATAEQLLVNDAENQYFTVQKGAQIPALTAYLTGTRQVRVSGTETLTKDRRSKVLAQTLVAACQTLQDNAGVVSAYAQRSLQSVIDEAAEVLRTQPEMALLNEQLDRLDSALVVFSCEIAGSDLPDGQLDRTYMIQNSSYESGSKHWATTSCVLNKLSANLSSYMARADGDYVMRVKEGGSVAQEVSGVENGTYTLSVDFAADYDQQLQMVANGDTLTQTAGDFGPMYMSTATLEGVKVTDGTLRIAASGVESWVKVDNWRLVQTEGQSVGIAPVVADTASGTLRQGIFDLQGRRLKSVPRRGAYIMNGRVYLK